MHERRVSHDIAQAALEAADGHPLVGVDLWIGALSHVQPDSITGALRSELGDDLDVRCEVSDDIADPRAVDLALTGVRVEDR